MKKMTAILLLLVMVLFTACQGSGTAGTVSGAGPSETTAPVTVTHDWLPTANETRPYEEYLSKEYPIDKTFWPDTNMWVIHEGKSVPISQDDGQLPYALLYDQQIGLRIVHTANDRDNGWFSMDALPKPKEPEQLWIVPNTQGMQFSQRYTTDGQWVYGIRDGREIVRIELLTGQIQTLHTATALGDATMHSLQLCGHDVLFYVAPVGEYLGLYRLYLPTMKLDLLYDKLPVRSYMNSSPVYLDDYETFRWSQLNEDVYPLLKEVLDNEDHELRQWYFTDDQWSSFRAPQDMMDQWVFVKWTEELEQYYDIDAWELHIYNWKTGEHTVQE